MPSRPDDLPDAATDEKFQEALRLHSRGDAVEPERLCHQILERDATHFNALNLLGTIYAQVSNYSQSLHYFERAAALNMAHAPFYNNYGLVLAHLRRFQHAIESYDKAIAIQADYPLALNNRGVVLANVNDHANATLSYEQALRLKPDYAEAQNNLGNAFQALGDLRTAVERYREAIRLKPNYVDAYINLGSALNSLNLHTDALESYVKAHALMPQNPLLAGLISRSRMRSCDWSEFDASILNLSTQIEHEKAIVSPFSLLALVDSPSLHRSTARSFTHHRCPENLALGPIPKRPRNRKIKVGYFSMDFFNHPTAHLAAELFENHDTQNFHITAFSYGRQTGDDMQTRLKQGFQAFFDVREKTDYEIAAMSRTLGIDIAVDLAGHTHNARAGIFALRAAPIQVSFLGYPGTSGAEYMDYIIADKTVIPEQNRQHFVEKIAYLPNCYQPNASWSKIKAEPLSRITYGLPESGVVFCCFNNNHKITPPIFDVWMRILKAVEESVLWLLADNETSVLNLRKEAMQRGVAGGRLVFADRTSHSEHLLRQCAADLFLDTLPYNAHTTASDALRFGLPVLTCPGEAFAGRVAASLLSTMGIPDLMTSTLDDYERRAIELATTPRLISELRKRILANARTSPLFNPQLFARHIESAYGQMYERYHSSLPPEHIQVGP